MDLSLIKLIHDKINEINFNYELNIPNNIHHRISKEIYINVFTNKIFIYKNSTILIEINKKDLIKIKTLEDLCTKLKKI